MKNRNYSWVEKYRPENLNEISAQTNVIKSLKSALHTKNIPHLIFFGPSGCGKTSTILALSKELFGSENYTDRIIELNASDERGINVIREKIKTYAKQSIKNIKGAPPWKIIILDEADTMTSDSQFALRRIIEQYSKITRFCIICNYHNKIIDPIIQIILYIIRFYATATFQIQYIIPQFIGSYITDLPFTLKWLNGKKFIG